MRFDLRMAAVAALAAAAGLAAAPRDVRAQNLGPQRQFLAVEPYYEYTRLDRGGLGKTDLNGYGARLWINGAPFHFPVNSSIALFASYTPDQKSVGQRTMYYGGQLDQFLVRRPLGGILDPVISISAGAYRRTYTTPVPAGSLPGHTTNLTFAPGLGLRIPIPNRLQLRADAKDLILFHDRARGGTEAQTRHNLLVQAGFGLTF